MKKKFSIISRTSTVFLVIVFVLTFLYEFISIILPGHNNIKNIYAANSDPHRAYFEYCLPGREPLQFTSGILRQTVMYVYAKEGETICFGSDIYDSEIDINENFVPGTPGADIVLTKPDGTKIAYDTIKDGTGYIGTLAQEAAGANYTGSGNTADYTPHEYTVPVDGGKNSGVYEIRFHSFSGNPKTTYTGDDPHKIGINSKTGEEVKSRINPDPVLTTSENWLTSPSTIGAWNITVIDKNETKEELKIKTGRTYTKILALNLGYDNMSFTGSFYVVTNDGYIYDTRFNEIQPFGFIFFSNNRGLIDLETGNSAYHSYQAEDNHMATLEGKLNITYHNPHNKDTTTDNTHLIFFEKPDPELVGIVYPRAYVPDEIDNIEFIGSKTNNISYERDGGYFKFSVQKATSATVKIIFSDYNAEHGTDFKDVSITENAYPGENFFFWDGCDGEGTFIPKGVYESSSIHVSVSSHAGEYHFPILDAENCTGNVSVERINKIFDRKMDQDGNLYDEDVTAEYEDQRYRVYYNNSTFNHEVYDDMLITDEREIAQIKKYLIAQGPYTEEEKAVAPLGNIASQTLLSKLKMVKVFDPETTQQMNGLSDEELEQVTETVMAERKDDELYKKAYFYYFAVIADERDCSDGMDTLEDNALHFSDFAGDMTAIDVWTYSSGAEKYATLQNNIIIERLADYVSTSVRGKVFYDSNNDTKYELKSGDYGLSGIEVYAEYPYCEARWCIEKNEDDVITKLYPPTNDEGFPVHNYVLVSEDGENFFREDTGEEVTVIKKTIMEDEETENTIYAATIIVRETTFTDINGNYVFKNVLVHDHYNDEYEDPDEEPEGDIFIRVVDPPDYYTLTTTASRKGAEPTGDFNTYGELEQFIPVAELFRLKKEVYPERNVFDVADVGFYYTEYEPPIILKKVWESNIAADPNRPTSVTFHLTGRDESGEIRYSEDIVINYYDNSWSMTMGHLPYDYHGSKMTYNIDYEIFTKNGITYRFDGTTYFYNDTGVPIAEEYEPYNSSIEDMNKTYTGDILTVRNAPLTKVIEIVKRADDDRSVLLPGAEFMLEKWDTEKEEWEVVSENLVTNHSGFAAVSDVTNGRYRLTETKAPDLYTVVQPFEFDVTDDRKVYTFPLYDPPSNIKVSLTKTVDYPYPDQRISFTVEVATDENFENKLPITYNSYFRTKGVEKDYKIFENIAIPRSDENRDIYVRVTEKNAGSYNLGSVKITASGNEVDSKDVPVLSTSGNGNGDSEHSFVFKLLSGEEAEGYYKYNIKMENKTKGTLPTIRFEKVWLDSNLNKKSKYPAKAIYAKLMRKSENTTNPEQVMTAVGGTHSSVSGKIVPIGESYFKDDSTKINIDKKYTDKGYFVIKDSSWLKNFTTPTYWYMPAYAPDGGKYDYWVEEITNENGNPLVVMNDELTVGYLEDYKIIPYEDLEETLTSRTKKVKPKENFPVQFKEITSSKTDVIDTNYQKKYFTVNYELSDITLQITKNSLSDINNPHSTKPLEGAEFTLYSSEDCNESDIISMIRTGEDGKGVFDEGLKLEGIYYLKETKAPTGYQIDGKIFRVTYDRTKHIKVEYQEGEEYILYAECDAPNFFVNISFTNAVNITIPTTGKKFTALNSAMCGVALMASAVFLTFVFYKRQKRESG